MNAKAWDETRCESAQRVIDALPEMDTARRLDVERQASEAVEAKMAELLVNNRAIRLTAEEIQLLNSFRAFKLRMRKNGEVFKWQTSIDGGIIRPEPQTLIQHPQEVS